MCVCLSHICVCLSVPYVCLPYCIFNNYLQLLYLPPPKGEQKAAGGGPFASYHKSTINWAGEK